MGAYATYNRSAGIMSRRAMGFAATAAFHILLVYGLITGLARSVVEVIKGPIETKIIEEIKQEDKPPPPPPPKFDKPPPPFVPLPDISISTEAPPAATAITQGTPVVRPAAPVAGPTPPARIKGRNYQPEYPPSSKRAGEEGVVTLLITVDEEGKVTDAKIEKSSGFEKLDEAALKEALRSWKFKPATSGGKPVATSTSINVRFKIENER